MEPVVRKLDGVPGKRALITGASSGLGLEFAEPLAAQKVNLVLAAPRREPMEKLATELRRKHGVDIVIEPIDLAATGAAARLKSSLDERSTQIDILVNNAGYGLDPKSGPYHHCEAAHGCKAQLCGLLSG